MDFKRWSRSRWLALWYFCIAGGFLLLTLRSFLLGGRPSITILRFIITIGFVLLGYFQLHAQKPPA